MNHYRKTIRAQFLDYNQGNFFITICTQSMKNYFGGIHDETMYYSKVGAFAAEQLQMAENYNPMIEIPLYVVMPNHIHAIVSLRPSQLFNPRDVPTTERNPNPFMRAFPEERRIVPALSKYVTSLKGSVTKYARENEIEFGWQPRYHDHLIRNSQDLNRIRDYIQNNVARWKDDCYHM